MLTRNCSACGRHLNKDSYSNNQWSKGVGISRCSACVHQNKNNNNDAVAKQTARLNKSTGASFTTEALDHPFAEGSFRWVARGVYTQGIRAGEACVCKWFKTGGVMESQFYDCDLAASNEAIRLITKWNALKRVNKLVRVNKPEVWTCTSSSRAGWAGKKVLQEPFISDYQKFNSNTGWTDDSIPWSRVMQALSHFTYHSSSGQRLLCDLQGGIYADGVVLTDPVVMSNVQGTFGPTDLGTNGISTFFAHHRCNEFCSLEWRRPRDQRAYFRRTEGSTMQLVPTRHSRQKFSGMAVLSEY